MANRKRKTVEWVLRGGELVAVFAAMSWALLWAATRWKRPAPAPASSWWPFRLPRVEGGPPAPHGYGRQLDSEDPDGAGFLERARRRRHID